MEANKRHQAINWWNKLSYPERDMYMNGKLLPDSEIERLYDVKNSTDAEIIEMAFEKDRDQEDMINWNMDLRDYTDQQLEELSEIIREVDTRVSERILNYLKRKACR